LSDFNAVIQPKELLVVVWLSRVDELLLCMIK
jgi:hypothetical protein